MTRILLIEDDPGIVASLSDYLKIEDMQVESAPGYWEARELLTRNNYNLALIDKMLKNGNGYDCFEEARKKNLPVIFLTASDDENSVVKGLDMGSE